MSFVFLMNFENILVKLYFSFISVAILDTIHNVSLLEPYEPNEPNESKKPKLTTFLDEYFFIN